MAKFDKKFVVRAAWVNSNAFCVEVTEYEPEIRTWIHTSWVKKKVHCYASWDSFMHIMWEKHMLDGKTLWEIDTKI